MAKAKRTAQKATQTAATNESQPKEMCFVIMPFGGWYDAYYENIYREAITKAGLTPKRADDLYRPSNIVQDIWELTKKAKIILADLTDKNPNVFYELGLAHALAKPAILITEKIQDIPFDLRSLRIIEYDKNVQNWGEVLSNNIEKAIKETMGSPIQTIPTAFLDSSRSGIKTPQLSRHEKEILELRQELELVKRQLTVGRFGASESISRYPRVYMSYEEYNKAKQKVPEKIIDEIRGLISGGTPLKQIVEILRTIWGLSDDQVDMALNEVNVKHL